MKKPRPLDLLDMQVDGLVAQARKVRDSKPEEMARFYLVVRGLYDEMETVNKKISELKRQMAEELIPEAFDQAGISTITLKEGYRVTISAFVRASSRDMAEGIKWMKKNGHADIVRETINAQTLSALARGMLEKNESLPEDLFNVYVGNNTSITKVA